MAREEKKETKISPSKQKIIDNYKEQRKYYFENGYAEKQEIISVVKANAMAFATAGPFAIACILIWVFAMRRQEGAFDIRDLMWAWILCLVCILIHELLHGVGWALWTQKGWKSIYLGVMWDSLTPYCHCKEPLKPKQYLVGGLFPFFILGIGVFFAALFTGSGALFFLSLVNILSAGGDTTIACMELKYLKKSEKCYILDHPTDCGFVAFLKRDENQA